jgi:diacylglycerol kinase (ATP)
MKVLFVINPVSGGKEKRDWEEQIRAYFKASPHNMEFFLLTGNNDVSSVRTHLERVKPDRVVAVGGDGTVKLLAEQVQGTSIPLGIIPAGSANGMARELGIPLDVNAALDVVVDGREQPIDLIRINDREICIHLSDIGLNAMLVKYFEKSKNRGMWGYGQTIFRMLWTKQKMRVTIHTDENTYRRQAYMVVVANARKYGTGANINPDGNVCDGYFEIVVVRKLNLIEVFKSLLTEKSFHPNRIEVFKTKRAALSTVRRTYFQVDGEYRGKITQLNAEILPAQLTVMLPITAELPARQ